MLEIRFKEDNVHLRNHDFLKFSEVNKETSAIQMRIDFRFFAMRIIAGEKNPANVEGATTPNHYRVSLK